MPPAFQDYIRWVQGLLPADKFTRFMQLLTFPLETTDSTKLIFDEISKVFDAHDKNVKLEFVAPEYEAEFKEYLKTKGEEEWWPKQGLEALRIKINSYLVIDLPQQQTGSFPEPYFYLLETPAIRDLGLNALDQSKVEFIAFDQTSGQSILIDDAGYYIFVRTDTDPEWREDKAILHDLGYCPVCPFYGQSITDRKVKPIIYETERSGGANRRGPITSALGKLDWMLFFKTSKKYLDTYGAWPIIITYKTTCEYKDEKGNACTGGYVTYERCTPGGDSYPVQKRCPVCQEKGVIGPGSFWEVDAPRDKDDTDLLKNPVHIVEISNDKLEYCVAEIERMENELFLNCVGTDGEAINDQAVNEKQVNSQFESRQSILNRIKSELERARKFEIETMARLRYGTRFLRGTVWLGSEFFLLNEEKLTLKYAEGKKSGMPQYEVGMIRGQYIRTKYKNNPEALQRCEIMGQLEPYPDLSITEAKGIGLDYIDPENFALKIDFNNFIAQFERENTNILEFGKLISMQDKITIIQTKLLDYVKRKRQAAASAQPNPGPAEGPAGAASQQSSRANGRK